MLILQLKIRTPNIFLTCKQRLQEGRLQQPVDPIRTRVTNKRAQQYEKISKVCSFCFAQAHDKVDKETHEKEKEEEEEIVEEE